MGTYDIVGGSDDDAASAYDAVSGEGGGGGGPQQVRADRLPRHYAGAGPVTIPASGTAVFTFNLNVQLRPDQPVIPDAIAPSVAVPNINVGAISLNASSDPAPGDMFRHNSTGSLRGAVSGSPSVPVKMTLLNLTTAALTGVYLGLKGPMKRV
jgi:hypothetical protein